MLALAAAMIVAMGQADPHSKADLIAGPSVVRPGSTFDVALRFRMDPGWHIYWKNPGESGIPPTIKWKLPKGWTAGPIEWPVPERIESGGIVNYAYEKEVLLLMKINVPATEKAGTLATLKGETSWLCCREACIPGKANLDVAVKVGASEVANGAWPARFAEVRKDLPRSVDVLHFAAKADGSNIRLTVQSNLPSSVYEGASFYCSDDAIEPSADQTVKAIDGGVEVTLNVSPYVSKAPARLRGLLLATKGEEWVSGRNAAPVDIPIQRSTK